MTETSADSPSDGRDFQTLHKNTTRARLFPTKQHKEEWWEGAEHEGSSLSRYLYDLIQEARMYRDSGTPFIQTQDQTVKQLQNRVGDLQTQLEEARQDGGGRTHLSIDDLVTRVLDQQYQSLGELIERASASDDVAQHLQRQIEDRLYTLTRNEQIEFQRGHGWRLKEGNQREGRTRFIGDLRQQTRRNQLLHHSKARGRPERKNIQLLQSHPP